MKKTSLLFLIPIISSCFLFKVDKPLPKEEIIEVYPQTKKDKEKLVFTVVEVQPEFPGGDEKMLEYLGKNILYPNKAKEKGIQGKVYVQFIVEKDGSITDAKVLKGIGGGCDEEALKVVKEMPRWNPGMQRGNPVIVRYNLPILFKLREEIKNPVIEEEIREVKLSDKPIEITELEDEQMPETKQLPVIFTIVENMPEFPGGEDSLYSFVKKNLNYPIKAIEKNIQGTVYIQFVVDEKGNVNSPKVLRGIGYGCDDESIIVVNKMPKWKPGTQRGKPVKVRLILPVKFELEN